jgi:aralkylamine N-acetyltransferase
MSKTRICKREGMKRAGDVKVILVQSWAPEEIVRLYRCRGWWRDEWDPAEILPLIHGSFAFAVAVDEKTRQAVGMGRVISDGVSDAYIQDLVLLPEYRRQGIGTDLLSLLMDACRSAHISWIGVVAEEEAFEFYIARGFRPMGGHLPMLHQEGI